MFLNFLCKKPIIIYGAGGFGEEVQQLLDSSPYKLKGFIDDNKDSGEINGTPIFERQKIIRNISDYNIVIAIGDPILRKKMFLSLPQETSFPSIISSNARIGRNVRIGAGTLILFNSIIESRVTLGMFVNIGSLSFVGHNSLLGNFVTTAPSTIICGECGIGDSCRFLSHSTLANKVQVGNGLFLAGNSLLNRNVLEEELPALFAGSPAVLKKRFSLEL